MEYKQSPNYQAGRSGNSIKRIIIHWIGAGTYESAVSWLTNKNSQVSAHLVISGKRETQLVKYEDTAWHAGNYPINLESIGIEHDAIPGRDATEETYQTSGKRIGELCRKYNIPIDRQHIQGHKEIKATQCPGTIDIDKLIRIAKESNLPEPNPGYAPTHKDQTVEKDGVKYRSYEKDGKLLWNIIPPSPKPEPITDDTIIPQIENKSVRDIKKELLDSRGKIKDLTIIIDKVKKAVS